MLLKGQCHETVCWLRPLVYSLGLNNALRIRFTLKHRASKVYDASNTGTLCKMAGAGFHTAKSSIADPDDF
jgi:hypothetical protein